MKVTGVPAHAGLKSEKGHSAIKEMAQQVLAIEGLTDYERGVTACVGTISGGTAKNVVRAALLCCGRRARAGPGRGDNSEAEESAGFSRTILR